MTGSGGEEVHADARRSGQQFLLTDGHGQCAACWGIRSLVTGCVYAWGSSQQHAELMWAATGTPERYEVVCQLGSRWVAVSLAKLPDLGVFVLRPQALNVTHLSGRQNGRPSLKAKARQRRNDRSDDGRRARRWRFVRRRDVGR